MPTIHCRLSGLYKFIVTRDGVIVRETPWQHNLITLAGLDQIGLGDFITQMQVGTGTTEAADTDTALETLLGTSTDITAQTAGTGILFDDQPPCFSQGPYGYGRWTFHFASDTVTGTITEAGAGWDTGLFSHVILDEAVVVATGEELDVVFELRNASRMHGEGGPFEPIEYAIGDDTHIGFMGAANVTSGSVDYGWGVTGDQVAIVAARAYDTYTTSEYDQACTEPDGTYAEADSVTNDDYQTGTYTKTASVTFGPSTANFAGGIWGFLIGTNGLGCFQFVSKEDDLLFDPPLYGPIMKVSPQTLTMQFAVRWYVDQY